MNRALIVLVCRSGRRKIEKHGGGSYSLEKTDMDKMRRQVHEKGDQALPDGNPCNNGQPLGEKPVEKGITSGKNKHAAYPERKSKNHDTRQQQQKGGSEHFFYLHLHRKVK